MRSRLAAIAIAAIMSTTGAAAVAAGCSFDHGNESVSQCPEGTAYDVTTGACVKQTTS